MEVLIVAKTRMASGACVGALLLEDNSSLRLLPEFGHNHAAGTELDVGQIWAMDFYPALNPEPPHTEDVRITRAEQIGERNDLPQFLKSRVEPWFGPPEQLFDGYLLTTSSGRGYLDRAHPVPQRSTGFWIPDADLQRYQNQGRVSYCYNGETSTIRYLPYVGYPDPVPSIPAGSLLRVSLARWWRAPSNGPEAEERCYLQISGWYQT
jgi:hypothetical protein